MVDLQYGDKPVTPSVAPIIIIAVVMIGIVSGFYWAYKCLRNRAGVNSIELSNYSKVSQQPEMESIESQNRKIDTSCREQAPVDDVTPPPDILASLPNNDSAKDPDPDSDSDIDRFPYTSPYSLVYKGNDSDGGGDVLGIFK
jgi:hypothetical protein